MKRFKQLLFIGVILNIALALVLPATASASVVTVSIDAPAEVGPGTSFIARVNITGVTNFDACDYNITYDPSVFNMTDVTAGLIGGTAIPIDFWNENVSDTIKVIENVPGTSGVNGSGYLAELHFDIIGPYSITSEIVISNGTLSDNTATQIQATWTNESVHVLGLPMPTATLPPTATPTPTPTETPADVTPVNNATVS